MDITVPAVLKTLSSSNTAAKLIANWWQKSTGDVRALIGELKDNLIYLDMVAEDGIALDDVIEKIRIDEFTRLSREGFNFNRLKKARIETYPSLQGTDLAAWGGKHTETLVISIYDKIRDIKIRYPHVKNHKKYRWTFRVNNIRKRIWLLLKHVND